MVTLCFACMLRKAVLLEMLARCLGEVLYSLALVVEDHYDGRARALQKVR